MNPTTALKWRALATDFDGTIAREGVVDASTHEALLRLKAGGMSLLLVTGREMGDFAALEVDLTVFDLLVLENGAILYDPHKGTQTVLTAPPSADLVAALQKRGVEPLSVGQTIIATTVPNEHHVLESIRELGLELTMTFNKGWVMILPANINKATGLEAALQHLQIPAAQVVGVGDAENDHAFLAHCGYAVAVANALPSLKERAHFTTASPAGEGVVELIDRLLQGELQSPSLPPPQI